MDTKEKLEQALHTAMKAGDDVTKRTIRMALAAIRQMEIDKQIKLDEAAVLAILQKEIKTRRESIEEASRVNRMDIVTDTNAEVKVLEAYLPPALNAEDLQALAAIALAETGATTPADMGKVMKVLMPRVAGRASGDQVSAVVRSLLNP
jgi:uncharacterized protein